MSREIDEKIVQMRFESGQFEKNVQTSIHSLEELKKGLDFKDATKGLEGIDKASKGLKFDGLAAGIEALNNRFTLLGITGLNVMNRIANAAINAGEQMVRSLSTDQISAGFSKYADKTSAVQTIMSATAKQFTDTGEQMAYVNGQLEKLNWFTDETSYNFLDMVSNIGKFTSNNIPLDQSVTSMQGIATWAAQAGANAGEASRAMYNLSQAISVGSVKLIDWKSIENANMATASFKETVLEMAAAEGTLIKQGDKFVTANKKSEVSVSNFNAALSEGWFTSKVLLNTLEMYGGAANRLNQIVDETEITTSRLIQHIDAYGEGTLDLSAAADELGWTVEHTEEVMKEFQDETMQFGLKAFKAAQEAKTFREAIESVKDAVSSGWMQTFEYIFGDYEKAKELWTDVANILYTLFAESGNARNALLKDWADWGGRELLLASFYNILTAVLKITNQIGKAWKSVFPPQTLESLLLLTESFYIFTQKLIISDKVAENIGKTFRGLFLILDTLRFIAVNAAKSAFGLLKRVLEELNVDVSGFVDGFEQGAKKLNDYVKNQTWATKAVEKFGDILIGAIRQIKSFINTVKEFGPVKSFLDALHNVFTTDFNGISSIVTFVGNTIAGFFSLIADTPFPQSLSDVKKFFSDFGNTISKELDTAGIDFSGFEKLLGSGWVTLTKLVETFISAVGMAGGSVGKAIKYIGEQLQEVDWSGAALFATGVAIVAMTYKIADALTSIANSLLAFTNIGKTIQGVFKGVTKVLESTANVIDATKWAIYGATMVEVAFSFGILAASLIALSKVPADDLQNTAFYLGLLGVTLTTFVYALGNVKSIPQVSGVLISFAVAIAAFVHSMNALDVSNTKDVVNRIAVIEIMLGSLLGVSVLMGRYSKPIQVGTTSLIGIVASIYLMMSLLRSIGDEDPKKLMMSMTVVSVMMLVLAGISRLLTQVTILEKDQKRVKSGGVLKLIGLMASLLLLIGVLKLIGNSDPTVLLKGVLGLVPIIVALGTLFIASKKVGQYAAQAGPMLLGAAAALYILVGVIKGLAEVPMGDIIKGSLVIIAIEQLAFVPLVKAAKYSGKNAAKVGVMLLAMAGALAIIQLVVKTIGKLDAATLIKGTAAVAVLVYSFTPMIAALKSQGNIEVTKQLTKLIIAIGLMGAIVFLLSKFTDPKSTLAAAASMSAIILSLSGTMRLMKGMKSETLEARIKTLYSLSAIAATMAVVLGVLSFATRNVDPKVALANAVSLGVIMSAISVSIRLIPKVSATDAKNIKALTGPIMGFIVSAGLVVAGLGLVSKYSDPVNTIALATALGEIMIATGYAMKCVPTFTAAQVKNINSLMTPMLTFLIASGGVVAALAYFGKDTNPVTTIALATSLGEVMVALGVSMKFMTGIQVPKTSELVKMGAFVGAVGLIIAGLSIIGDPVKMLALATGISELLLALSISVGILNAADRGGGQIGTAVGTAFAMAGIATVIGIVLSILSQMTNPDTVLPIATGISLVLLAMSGAVGILSLIPSPSIGAAIKTVGVMIVLIGSMAAMMYALGSLIGDANTVAVLHGGGEVLKEVGVAIGGFVGGIIGGIVGGTLQGIMESFPAVCKALADGTSNLLPMFENLQKIPGGALEMIGTLIGMVAAMTAAEFIAGLEKIPVVGGLIAAGKENMTENFSKFGEALTAFSNSLGDMNAYRVKTAAEAVAALAGVQGDLKEGGLMGLLFGSSSDSFTKFAANVPELGRGLKEFATETEGITEDSVKGAVAAADMLVALEKSVAPTGGIMQMLFGEQDLTDFGHRIITFAGALVGFGALISGQNGGFGLNQEAVDAAQRAGTMLIELEKSLPPNGGLIQDLFLGNKDLAGFGLRLQQFGNGLSGFSEVCASINNENVNKGIIAARSLVDLENSITTQAGGLWGDLFGEEGSFSSFGKNLIDLGEGIRSLGNKANVTDFDAVNKMIEVITSLGDAGTIDSSITGLVNKIKDMFTSVKNVIRDSRKPIYEEALAMGKHMINGIINGINDKKQDASDAIASMANSLVERFRRETKIQSPSVVMKEQGVYLVEGVAEGIESSQNAEEAAEKKAQNIISAFQTIFDNADLKINFGNVKLETWTVNEGRGAGWQAKLEKDIEAKKNELSAIGEKVKASYAKWLALQQSGANEKTIREAEIEYLQMSNSYVSMRNDIIDAQIDSAESMIEELDLLDQVRQAEYDRWLSSKEGKSSSAVEKTAKEMELLVSQLESVADTTAILWAKHQETVKEFGEDSVEAKNAYIKALNSEQKLNETYDSIMEKQQGSFASIREARDSAIRAYSEFMNETAPKLMEMGFTMEQVQEQAKKSSNWDQYWGGNIGGVSTEQIDAAMERAHKPVELVKENLVDTIGGEAVDGITVQLVEGVPVAVTKAGKAARQASVEAGQENAEAYSNSFLDTAKKTIEPGLKEIKGQLFSGTQESWLGDTVAAGKVGYDNMMAVLNGANDAAGIQSPSKRTYEMGNYLVQGLVNAIDQNGSKAEDSMANMMDSALTGAASIATRLTPLLSSDMDLSPTITPVLNMDEIKNQSKQIPGILNSNRGLDVSSINIRAQDVSASLKKTGAIADTDANTSSSGNTYNFTQNNYSPKALSRYEIYRQTRNQFSQLKGATSK